jgi:hypothetical protein
MRDSCSIIFIDTIPVDATLAAKSRLAQHD